jgi:hypothetical protein
MELLGLTSALLCVLVAAPAPAQTAVSLPPEAQKAPVSLPHLYWHFLVYQNHLDRLAAQRRRQGKDGSWLRNYYQKKLDFTDSEFQAVREAGLRLAGELQQIDSRVQAVIQEARARQPRKLTSPEQLPPVPPELVQLGQQRESVIETEAANLRKALSPESAAKLDAFLQNVFAPNVKVQFPGPPRPHDPANHSIPPFRTEVQP